MWHESFCWCWSEKTANAPMENLQRCLQPANVTRGRLAGCSIFPRMRWWCLFWYKKCTPGGIRTHGLSLRRRKKCSPPLPFNVPQVLDFTGFLTISGRSHFLRKTPFYPSAISRKLAELILAVGHFPGSFAKISKLTEITFLKKHQISGKSSVLLNPVRCCDFVHILIRYISFFWRRFDKGRNTSYSWLTDKGFI